MNERPFNVPLSAAGVKWTCANDDCGGLGLGGLCLRTVSEGRTHACMQAEGGEGLDGST